MTISLHQRWFVIAKLLSASCRRLPVALISAFRRTSFTSLWRLAVDHVDRNSQTSYHKKRDWKRNYLSYRTRSLSTITSGQCRWTLYLVFLSYHTERRGIKEPDIAIDRLKTDSAVIEIEIVRHGIIHGLKSPSDRVVRHYEQVVEQLPHPPPHSVVGHSWLRLIGEVRHADSGTTRHDSDIVDKKWYPMIFLVQCPCVSELPAPSGRFTVVGKERHSRVVRFDHRVQLLNELVTRSNSVPVHTLGMFLACGGRLSPMLTLRQYQ